jgi:hypothetical protein
MSEIITALGLVLVIEGLIYAILPDQVRKMMVLALETPADRLRVGGLVAAGAGVAVVWVAKSMLTAS